MSHYFVGVIVPTSTENIELFIQEKMKPYDESLECNQHVEKTASDITKEKYECEKQKNDLDASLWEEYGNINFVDMSNDEFAKFWYEKELDKNGNLLSKYNENTKYDWYIIGGGWEGLIKGKIERNETGGLVSTITKNINTIDNYLKLLNELNEDKQRTNVPPYAILTPDSQWFEKGKMGMFGSASDEKEDNVWTEEVIKVLKKYKKDYSIVGIDCHI